MVTSRDTARATSPSAVPNGASVSSSPWATAASTGAGTSDLPVTSVDQQLEPRSDVRVGPRAAEPVVVDEVGGGQRVQPCQRLHRRLLPHTDERRGAALQRLRHPKGTREERIGLAGFSELQRAALEHRRRPAPPAAPPRRPSSATPAGWCGAGALCRAPRGPLACVGDAGQFGQRCQRVRCHSGKASGARTGTQLDAEQGNVDATFG